MTVRIDHVNKTVTISKNLTDEENLEVAGYIEKGYKAQRITSKQKGHNKKWVLDHLPNDEAKAEFTRILESEKGIPGWQKAKKWAKDTYGIA